MLIKLLIISFLLVSLYGIIYIIVCAYKLKKESKEFDIIKKERIRDVFKFDDEIFMGK